MRKIIVICVWVVLEFTLVTAHAATYTWSSKAGNENWDTAENWTVDGSKYTWPNQQNNNHYINDDCDPIIIDNGATVRRDSYLSIDGLANSFPAMLILENGSKLILNDAIYLANALGKSGYIGIRDGATLEVNGKILDIGNDGNGSVLVSNGRLIVKNALHIATGKYSTGAMTVSGKSTVTVGTEMILSYYQSSKSELIINDGTMIINERIVFGGGTASCRLFLNGGTLQCAKLKFNHITSKIIYTGGLLLINGENLSEKGMQELVSSKRIDVSGAKNWKITTKGAYTVLGSEAALAGFTAPAAPAVKKIEKVAYKWIGGSGGMDNDAKWSTGRSPVKDNHFLQNDCGAVIISGNDAKVTVFHFSINLDRVSYCPVFTVEKGASLSCNNAIWLANDAGTVGKLVIRSGGSVKIKNLIDIGNDGTGELEISNGSLAVTGSKMGIRVGPNLASDGAMTISGNSTITSAGYLRVGSTLQGNATLTIYDGTVTISGDVNLGVVDGKDTGKHRIYLKGGTLQGDNLLFGSTDSKIIYTGGKLLINATNFSEADMRKLVSSRKIEVFGAKNWKITTLGGYTALVSKLQEVL